MADKIDGGTRFTAIQDGENGEIFLAFYAKKEDVGNLEKASGLIEFPNWEKYREFIMLQATLYTRIDRAKNNQKEFRLSGN